uniref:Uncharacterized protein n=1 Tax=Candidatus Kentrum sp. DK TaxID=2126562 RepID=A0A450TEH7_9GAMM|nr:MAG: hypothetical protein BECKDK2373C_GA0170839_11314 [Candidatus Kentron sp. DK]
MGGWTRGFGWGAGVEGEGGRPPVSCQANRIMGIAFLDAVRFSPAFYPGTGDRKEGIQSTPIRSAATVATGPRASHSSSMAPSIFRWNATEKPRAASATAVAANRSTGM